MLYNYIELKDMKGLNYSLMRIICALIIGLLLVLFPVQAGEYLVITIGVVFLVPSLISLIGYLVQKAELRRRFPVEGLGSLLFGLWLVVMPGFFADLLTFVLGFILMMGGVQQMASLMAARSWMKVPGGFYVVPLLILIAGIVTLFNPTGGTFDGLYHYWCDVPRLCLVRAGELDEVYPPSSAAPRRGSLEGSCRGC